MWITPDKRACVRLTPGSSATRKLAGNGVPGSCSQTGPRLDHVAGVILMTRVILTPMARVGRSPWTAPDALVPLLEAGRRFNAPAARNAWETVPT